MGRPGAGAESVSMLLPQQVGGEDDPAQTPMTRQNALLLAREWLCVSLIRRAMPYMQRALELGDSFDVSLDDILDDLPFGTAQVHVFSDLMILSPQAQPQPAVSVLEWPDICPRFQAQLLATPTLLCMVRRVVRGYVSFFVSPEFERQLCPATTLVDAYIAGDHGDVGSGDNAAFATYFAFDEPVAISAGAPFISGYLFGLDTTFSGNLIFQSGATRRVQVFSSFQRVDGFEMQCIFTFRFDNPDTMECNVSHGSAEAAVDAAVSPTAAQL